MLGLLVLVKISEAKLENIGISEGKNERYRNFGMEVKTLQNLKVSDYQSEKMKVSESSE